MVTLANEEGMQETHYVPNESFRRRMAVFFFENVSGDPAQDWLQYGLTELLVQDLQQNPFVLATSPWANFQRFTWRLVRCWTKADNSPSRSGQSTMCQWFGITQ